MLEEVTVVQNMVETLGTQPDPDPASIIEITLRRNLNILDF
jgi:hypothetical protein